MVKLFLALICSLVIGCATESERPEAPTILLVPWAGQELEQNYIDGAMAWYPLGFDVVTKNDKNLPECTVDWMETGEYGCVIKVTIERSPHARELGGADAFTIQNERRIVIDTSVTNPYNLILRVAHEVGHVVLHTGEHTLGGVMGGSSTQLMDVDYELACEAIHICI